MWSESLLTLAVDDDFPTTYPLITQLQHQLL